MAASGHHAVQRHQTGKDPVTRFRLSVYNDSHGPVRPDSYLEFTAMCRASGVPLAPLILDSMRTFPFKLHQRGPGRL